MGYFSRLGGLYAGSSLSLFHVSLPGECQEQCRTIARSCHDTMEAADLGVVSEAIWKGAKRAQVTPSYPPLIPPLTPDLKRSQVSQLLCRDQTRACRKKAPKTPANRLPGSEFKALSEEDAKMRDTMRNLKKSGMGGTLYSRDEMMDRMKERGGNLMGEGGEPKGEL